MDVVRAAAVLAGDTSVQDLAAMAGREPAETLSLLVDAERAALLTSADGHGLEGISRLHALLAEHAPADWAELPAGEVAGRVVVGIETDRGPWVTALRAAGYRVFAINPLSAARYRQRHSTSGAKSDARDAHGWGLGGLRRRDCRAMEHPFPPPLQYPEPGDRQGLGPSPLGGPSSGPPPRTSRGRPGLGASRRRDAFAGRPSRPTLPESRAGQYMVVYLDLLASR